MLLSKGYSPFELESFFTNQPFAKKVLDMDPDFSHFDGNYRYASYAKDFISQCLIKDQAKRPEVSKLLEHEWFTQTYCNLTRNVRPK